MNNKKTIIILAILLIIAIGAAVYFGYFKNKNQDNNKQTKVGDQITTNDGKIKSGFLGDKKTFTDNGNTYSIEFSKDWSAIGKDKMNQLNAKYDVAIVNNSDATICIGINGPNAKDKEYEKDLDGLLNALAANLKKQFEDKKYTCEIITQKNGKTDQFSYTYLVLKIIDPASSKETRIIQKNIIGQDKMYTLTASAASGKYEANEKTLNEIIDSFSLK